MLKLKSILPFLSLSAAAIPVIASKCDNEDKISKKFIKIIDSKGNNVSIPINPTKIAIPARSGFGMLVAFNKHENISAIYKSLLDNEWLSKIIPYSKNYKSLEYKINKESYLKEAYDLVISPDQNNFNKTKDANLSTMIISQYHYPNYDDYLFEYCDIITKIFPDDDNLIKKANKWKEDYQKIIDEIKMKLKDENPTKNVFYVRGDKKNKGINYTEPDLSIQGSFMRLLKVNYLPSKYQSNDSTITEEQLIKDNPDYFILGGQYQNQNKEILLKDPKYSQLNAVKNKKIFNIPIGIIPFEQLGVENMIYLAALANYFWPEKFKFDIDKMIKDSYKYYYNYDLTATEIEKIKNGQRANIN
ncbi:ABC transporter substrate-binding protein [Mycoplasma enhydrae]|uniref:ABC transporter substrate-binding protein n=1 Tax=Mycoplasma enhydrae TaxID=2499220 RepID=UPI00197C12AE|nr:ABC transporter substrate-binding protein [Mycoplasma enhydrae]MBN4089676.1 ABC transporter substrate-binding protein [Mycoplasma enhydrae]